MKRKVIEPYEKLIDGEIFVTLECGHLRPNQWLDEDELTDDAPVDCRIAGPEVWCGECAAAEKGWS